MCVFHISQSLNFLKSSINRFDILPVGATWLLDGNIFTTAHSNPVYTTLLKNLTLRGHLFVFGKYFFVKRFVYFF